MRHCPLGGGRRRSAQGGEGLWGNEATGEANQILLSVQEAWPFAPRTPPAIYAMFAESVGNTPQGHARSYYSRLDDGHCQARAGFQAAQDAHLPRSQLPGQNQVSQRSSWAPAVPTLRGPGKEHLARCGGRLSQP